MLWLEILIKCQTHRRFWLVLNLVANNLTECVGFTERNAHMLCRDLQKETTFQQVPGQRHASKVDFGQEPNIHVKETYTACVEDKAFFHTISWFTWESYLLLGISLYFKTNFWKPVDDANFFWFMLVAWSLRYTITLDLKVWGIP